jgi:hypothetical protein
MSFIRSNGLGNPPSIRRARRMKTAQRFYEAYAKHTGWKNFMGDSMPPWHQLPLRIQEAWQAVVEESYA